MSDYYTGRTTFCYDQRGNVTVKRNSLYGGALNYAYTLADRLASVAYPNGDKVTYGYDTVGRTSSVSYQPSGGGTTSVVDSVAYYPFGPVNLITFHNGRKLSKFYDQDYAIDKVISTAADGLLIDATPDVLGNLKTASSAVGASPPTRSFQYDPLYRLTGVTDASSASLESYSYNRTGDRLSKTLAGQSTQTYSYGTPLTSHRLQSVAGVVRTYDQNGNTTGRGDNTLYTYSDANRLADVCQPLSCPSTTATHYGYFYNGLGQRSLKQTSSMHAFSSTSYAYDERGQLLYELAAAGATDYLYLDGLPVGVVVGGQIYYVETDQLGTPREVANTSNGLRWKWDYFGTTFGETAPNQNPSGLGSFTFNLRFPGQYYDAETGNHYNYFRDYEPQTGRYIESDPIGLRGGANTFSYGDGTPLVSIDRTGLIPAGADQNCFRTGECKCATAECAGGLPPAMPPQICCDWDAISRCMLTKFAGGGKDCVLCFVSRARDKAACRTCAATSADAFVCVPENCGRKQ